MTKDCPYREEITEITEIIQKVENEIDNPKLPIPDSNTKDNKNKPRDPTKVLRITNLSEEADKEFIYREFRKYGCYRVHLVRDKDDNRIRGFGFIEFDTIEDAKRAKSEKNNFPYQSLLWSLDYADPRN